MLASGFAGLGYQIVWTQQSALWLGHETAGVLAVVTAFFGGLAAGSLLLGSRIESGKHPVRWYAGCELLIAVWSLLLALFMAPFSNWLLDITGAQPTPLWQWTVAFIGTFVLLLPATSAMGATLPAMARIAAQWQVGAHRIAALYASNTFGAVIGVLAIAFWLIPELGLVQTTMVCASLNAMCGAAALQIFPGPSEAPPDQRNVPTSRRVLIRLALTGLLGIGYEVLVVRVLSQVAEDTVYTFAMLLAVYLVGSAVGAAAYARWITLKGSNRRGHLDDKLICALATACLVGTASLWFAEHIKATVLTTFGSSMIASVSAEAVLALTSFALPTLLMGALFSHLSARAAATGTRFGHALAVNTLGAAVAPLLFGVLAVPALGAKLSLLLVAAGYLGLVSLRSWSTPHFWIPTGATLGCIFLAPPLTFVDVPDGGRIVSYREGAMAAVSVVEDANGVAVLRINNRQQEGSNATLRVDARQAVLPILLNPAAANALFLGVGTGVTAASAAAYSNLQVDAVDLLPEVIDASSYFTPAITDHTNLSRLHLMTADARRYVRAAGQRYDIIVSDNFHPARSGSGSLYTVEHFKAVRNRLSTQGIFCQWLPLHQLDLETLRSIVRSFLSVYPTGWAMLASNSLETPVLGLIGRKDNGKFDVAALREQFDRAMRPEALASIGIEDELALLGGFAAGPLALQQFAGTAVLNTDDRPVVAYRAPRITYAPDSLPRDRLVELLQRLFIEPADLVTGADAQWSNRLAAYWTARNRFIDAGRYVQPMQNVRTMLIQVREPLLSALRISPDFRPAYDPLLRMATVLARTDAREAQALLEELSRIQPLRPEANKTLQAILNASETLPNEVK